MASVMPVVDGFVLRKGVFVISNFNIVQFRSHVRLPGLVYSALPKLVQAHARHVLVTPTPSRRGIELFPHQLIANKLVSAKSYLSGVLSERSEAGRAWSDAAVHTS